MYLYFQQPIGRHKKLFIVLKLFQKTLAFSDELIENFQDPSTNISHWLEHSDTIMKEGKSKSSIVLFKNSEFQRAILFTLLNPQSCGAALAGIKKHVRKDYSPYTTIYLSIRGQGQYKGYEFIIRHNGDHGTDVPTYCHFFEVYSTLNFCKILYIKIFQAPTEFDIISLSLKDFKPYLRGQVVVNGAPLNKSNITSIGILAYGGAHLMKKQRGVASLEIEWIKIR